MRLEDFTQQIEARLAVLGNDMTAASEAIVAHLTEDIYLTAEKVTAPIGAGPWFGIPPVSYRTTEVPQGAGLKPVAMRRGKSGLIVVFNSSNLVNIDMKVPEVVSTGAAGHQIIEMSLKTMHRAFTNDALTCDLCEALCDALAKEAGQPARHQPVITDAELIEMRGETFGAW